MELQDRIDKAIKDYDLREEIKDHYGIIDRYKNGDLNFDYGDESGDEGFWDEAGILATRDVEFGDAEKWDEAIANQDVIYYGFKQICKEIIETKSAVPEKIRNRLFNRVIDELQDVLYETNNVISDLSYDIEKDVKNKMTKKDFEQIDFDYIQWSVECELWNLLKTKNND